MQIKLGLTYKTVNNGVPKYLSSYFYFFRDNQTMEQEAAQQISFFTISSTMGTNTFLYMAAIEWNKLPVSRNLIEAEKNFKQAMKKWLGNLRIGISEPQSSFMFLLFCD